MRVEFGSFHGGFRPVMTLSPAMRACDSIHELELPPLNPFPAQP